ncbi:SprT-like domain-containing protein, partial [Streptococcus pneumoniae]|uniref:SprT-like domain-containing protein n=1 Tax=Streptococcus pneumoniae TaxID=1313 RepID=UPI00398E7C59
MNGTPDLIKRLVYHEAIHYVQSSIGADRRDPHGEFFKKCMNEINAGEGYECVTIKSPAIDY